MRHPKATYIIENIGETPPQMAISLIMSNPKSQLSAGVAAHATTHTRVNFQLESYLL